LQTEVLQKQTAINVVQADLAASDKYLSSVASGYGDVLTLLTTAMPSHNIFGMAFGGDQAKWFDYVLCLTVAACKEATMALDVLNYQDAENTIIDLQQQLLGLSTQLANNQFNLSLQNSVLSLAAQLNAVQKHLPTINQRLRDLSDAEGGYSALVAQGNRLQLERQTFRQHAAALVQGYRTRDAAFRIFQNEKLERYKVLFDLAAEYAFLAANAYGLRDRPAQHRRWPRPSSTASSAPAPWVSLSTACRNMPAATRATRASPARWPK